MTIANVGPPAAGPGLFSGAGRFYGQIKALLTVLRVSRVRNRIIGLSLGVALVVLLTAAGQVRLNTWWGAFYDALAHRELAEFGRQLALFSVIMAFLVVCGVSQTWLQEMLKVRLREGLTRDLLDQWLRPRYAYRLAALGDIGVNPDQRLQEDARHLTELTTDLGVGLFQQGVLLVSFIGMLWVLSDRITLPIEGRSVVVPGYMVWCAVIYASAGSLLTWLIGRPLIRYNAEHYAREATLRFSLVRISESVEGIALDAGEDTERRVLDDTLDRVLDIMRKLASSLARLTWVTSSYGYVALVFPIVVASPGYFEGTLSFGALMMVVGAFNQVQGSLRWAVDNFPRIADWSATFLRVMTFYEALIGLSQRQEGPHIVVLDDHDDQLQLRALRLTLADGTAALDPDAAVTSGERVEIVGAPGSGKEVLFRVLAGLATDGTGTVSLPPRDLTMFMPQRPYLPPGALRDVLTYPSSPAPFGDARLAEALGHVGLKRLAGALPRVANWGRELSLGEQQGLALVRLMLLRPSWLIMHEVLNTLDATGRRFLLELLDGDLARTAVISIDTAPFKPPLFTRTLHLRKLGGGEAHEDHEKEGSHDVLAR